MNCEECYLFERCPAAKEGERCRFEALFGRLAEKRVSCEEVVGALLDVLVEVWKEKE